MATKAEERRTAVTEYLQSSPGAHTADQIAAAIGAAASDTVRALAQLTKSGTITETEPDADGAARWTATTDDTTDASDATADSGEPESETATAEAEALEDDGDADTTSGEAQATRPDIEPVWPATPTGESEDADSAGDEHEDTAPESEGAQPDEGDDAPAAEDFSDGTEQEAGQEEDEEEPEPEPVDPDPAVLLVAAQLAVLDGPVSLEQVALAAFRIAAPKTVETTLHVLCALAEHGAVECSTPYRPDDRNREEKAEWTVAVDTVELDRIAAIAQLADAPASVECPTCGSETELPHLKGHGRKPVGPGGKKRTGLANGELRDMLILLVKENPGEKMKPNDFVRELRNDSRFKDRISANPSGAVRSALLAMEKDGWVTDLGIQPLTYRCHDAK